MDELERDGWTPAECSPDYDYLGWVRGTVMKTLRYDEGSGWVWDVVEFQECERGRDDNSGLMYVPEKRRIPVQEDTK